MDFSAVTTATDDQLRELGVLRRGDLLSLQGFVKQKLKGENRDEKKRKLLDLLKGKGKPKKKRLKIKLVLDLELHVTTRVKKQAKARYIWDGYISILHRKGMCLFAF